MRGTEIDRPRRYIIIRDGRIVATAGGTHRMMEAICARLDQRRGDFHQYDDASEAGNYLPQQGPNVALNPAGC